MPYFIILPIYLFLLLIVALVALAVRFVPRIRWLSGYLIGGLVGAIPGFVIANILLTGVAVLPAWLSVKMPVPKLMEAARIFTLTALLIGPFFASAIGVFLGFGAGVLFVLRRRRRTGQPERAGS
jgi:hypothetical protein